MLFEFYFDILTRLGGIVRMKRIYRNCGKISLIFYIFTLYNVWHLSQYGGVRSHLFSLVFGATGFLISFICHIMYRKQQQEGKPQETTKRKILRGENIIFLVVTIYFASRIIYSAIPYNGALSWKIDEWMRTKEVYLEHNNFFTDGVEGVLTDLDETLNLPDELYISNEYRMTFDKEGNIKTIYTFLYGKDEKGKTKTYLVDYNIEKNDNMIIRIDGQVNETYDDDMRLEPMLVILQNALNGGHVEGWTANNRSETYEILYFGRRSFNTEDGLRYLPGDVDADGVISGENDFSKLGAGGKVIGYEVSLHIPTEDEITPVRYIMEPEYISQEVINKELEQEQVEEAKDVEDWTVDSNDGTMYFFLDDVIGWRLVVTDAAAGSRFYVMEQTEDGGKTWAVINDNPFDGNIGVTEGLVFFDENLGFAGLTGASQSASRMYITRDSGLTFTQIDLPMDTVSELPKLAEEWGLTIEDYDYLYMPEKEDETITIRVVTEALETEGLIFQSVDGGTTWVYVGTTSN